MKLNGQIVYKRCAGCKENKPIAYQKGELCTYCNQKRLIEIKKDKKNKKYKGELLGSYKKASTSIIELKKTYSINKLSKKGQTRKAKLKEVYRKIDIIAMEEGEYFCKSCGTTSRPLSHSHTIEVSQRKDLELDPENIVIECMSWGGVKGCHNIWENGTLEEKKTLLTFNDKANYIKKVDSERYQKLING